MENMNTTLEDDNMERTCNSCQKQNQCPKFNNLTEEERSELSCQKYDPMDFETLQIEDLGTIGNCAGCLVEIYMNRCGNFRNDKNMILCPLCYINYLVLKGMEMYFTDIEKLKQ